MALTGVFRSVGLIWRGLTWATLFLMGRAGFFGGLGMLFGVFMALLKSKVSL